VEIWTVFQTNSQRAKQHICKLHSTTQRFAYKRAVFLPPHPSSFETSFIVPTKNDNNMSETNNTTIQATISNWLENMYQNKVVYHEKFTLIVQLDEIEISSTSFKARATRIGVINVPPFLKNRKSWNEEQFFKSNFNVWEIALNLKHARLIRNKKSIIGMGSFQLCTDPTFVEKMDKLIIQGSKEEANKYIKKQSPFFD